MDGFDAADSMTAVDSKRFQNEDSTPRGFEHARLVPTYSDSDDEDDCYEDIEEIRR